jgi:hypothetical protein
VVKSSTHDTEIECLIPAAADTGRETNTPLLLSKNIHNYELEEMTKPAAVTQW